MSPQSSAYSEKRSTVETLTFLLVVFSLQLQGLVERRGLRGRPDLAILYVERGDGKCSRSNLER